MCMYEINLCLGTSGFDVPYDFLIITCVIPSHFGAVILKSKFSPHEKKLERSLIKERNFYRLRPKIIPRMTFFIVRV